MGYLTTLGGTRDERTPEQIAAAGVPEDPNRTSDSDLALGVGVEQARQIAEAPLEYGARKLGAYELAARVRGDIRESKTATQERVEKMTPEAQAAYNATFFDDGKGGQTVWEDPWTSFKLKALSSAPLMAASVVPGVAFGPVGVAVAGGYLQLGETADAVNQQIDGMSHDELYKGSQAYRQLIDDGVPEPEARNQVREMVLDMSAPISAIIGAAINRFGPEGMLANAVHGKEAGGGLIAGMLKGLGMGTVEETVEGAVPAAGQEYARTQTSDQGIDWWNVAEQAAQEGMIGGPFGGIAGGIEGLKTGPRVQKVPVAGPDAAMQQALSPPGTSAGGASTVPPAPPAPPAAGVTTAAGGAPAGQAQGVADSTGSQPTVGTRTPPPGGKRPKQNAKKAIAGPTVSVGGVSVAGVDPALQAAMGPPANAVRGEAQDYIASQGAQEQLPAQVTPAEVAPAQEPAPQDVLAQTEQEQAPPVSETSNVPGPPPAPDELSAGVPSTPAFEQSGDAGDAGVSPPASGTLGLASHAMQQQTAPRILPDIAAEQARQAEIERAAQAPTGEARGTRYEEGDTSPKAVEAWRQKMMREARGANPSAIATEVAGIRGARGTKLGMMQRKRLMELYDQWVNREKAPVSPPVEAKPKRLMLALPGDETSETGAPITVRSPEQFLKSAVEHAMQEHATPADQATALAEILGSTPERDDIKQVFAASPVVRATVQYVSKLQNNTATPEDAAAFEAATRETVEPSLDELMGQQLKDLEDAGEYGQARKLERELVKQYGAERVAQIKQARHAATQDIEAARRQRGGTGEVEVAAPAEGETSLAAEQVEAQPEQEQAGAAETEVTTKARTSAEDRSAEAFKKKAAEHTSQVRKVEITPEMRAKYEAMAPKAQPKPEAKPLPAEVTEEKPGVAKVKAATKRVAAKKAKPKALSETQVAQQREEVTNEAGRHLIHLRQQASAEFAKNGASPVYEQLMKTVGKLRTQIADSLGEETAARVDKMVDAALSLPTRLHAISRENFRSYTREHSGGMNPTVEFISSQGTNEQARQIRTVHTTTFSQALGSIDWGAVASTLRKYQARFGAAVTEEINRVLTSTLRERVGNIKVLVVSDQDWAIKLGAPRDARAAYDFSTNQIIMPQRTWENTGQQQRRAETLLHEGVHAAFTTAIHASDVAWDHLTQLRRLVDQQINRKGMSAAELEKLYYALSTNDEFIAHAFTHPRLQAEMAKIQLPAPMAKKLGMEGFRLQSMWSGFVNLVRNTLGWSPQTYNTLEAVIRVTTRAGSEYGPGVRIQEARFEDPFAEAFRREREPGGPRLYSRDPVAALTTAVENQVARVAPTGKLSQFMLYLRTLHQKTQLADRYWPKGMALQVSNVMERTRLMKQELVNKAQKFMLTEMHQLQNAEPEQFMRFQELAQAATSANIHPDVPLDHAKNKHVTDSAKWDYARKVHARLYAEWQKLPQEFKDVWHKTQKYFTDTQNEIVKLSLDNMVEQVLGRADKELADRMFNGTVTEEDLNGVFKTNRVLRAINNATELKRLKGAYFPQMRRGNYVVTARYKLPDWVNYKARTKEGKLTRSSYEFTDKKDFDRFIADMDKRGLHTTIETYSVDDTTGQRTYTYPDPKTGELAKTKTGNIKQFRFRKGDTGTHEVWRANVQDRLVEFHESDREAKAAEDELRADKNYEKVTREEREKLNYQKTTATSLQIRRAINSMKQTKYWEKMSDAERTSAQQGMMELSLNHLSATAPLNRARPRRNVMGASKDMVRNAAEYAASTAGAIAQLRNRPALDKAFTDLKDYADKYRYEGDNRSMPRSQLLNSLYADAYARDLAPPWVNRYINGLLAVSFMDKLVSPAFHMINSMQPWMVALPVISGRHGYAKSTYELSRAYRDMGLVDVFAAGVKDTVKAAHDMLNGTTDYMADMRKRLAKAKDGGELADMLDYLAQHGLIDKDAGMEVSDLLDSPSKVGHALHRIDHVIRQFGTAGEVANRASTAIAAYRLERAKGASAKEAQIYAQEVVANTQGNYSVTNAPVPFRSPLGRLALQFKKYPQMLYFLMSKLAYNTFKGATTQEKLEAAKGLAGLLAMHVAFAGALGLPTEPIKYPWMLLSFFLPMPKWDELEQQGTELAQQFFGENMGDAVAHGLPRLAGVDLHSRVGANSLITFGEPRSDKENDVWAWVAQVAAGAPGGLVADWLKGANDMSNGDYADAFEKMIPMKALSDAVRGYRRATSGTKNARGEQTSQGYGVMKGIMQGIGFKPAEEAVRQEKTQAFFTQKGNREQLMRSLENEFLSGKNRPDVRKRIIQYNASVPKEARITMSNLVALAKRKKTDVAKGYVSKGIYGGKINKDLLQKYIGQ